MCSTVLTQFVYLLKVAINFFSLDKTQNPLSEDFDKSNSTLLINEWLLRSSVGDFNVKRGFFVQIKLSLYNTDVSDCTVKNTITILNILSANISVHMDF